MRVQKKHKTQYVEYMKPQKPYEKISKTKVSTLDKIKTWINQIKL